MSAETKEALEQALRNHIEDEGTGDEPVYVTHWVLVAGAASLSLEDDAGFWTEEPDGQLDYVTLGLLHSAVRALHDDPYVFTGGEDF